MTKTKILFVTFHDIWRAQDGGSIFSKNCYDALCEFCDVEAFRIDLKGKNTKKKASVFLPMGKGVKEEIYQRAKAGNFDAVFFTSSLFGHVIWYLHKRGIRTICYFQNCEYDYYRAKEKSGLKAGLKAFIAYLAEKSAARYSDYTIGLNQRDSRRIEHIYHRMLERIIPISLKTTSTNTRTEYKKSVVINTTFNQEEPYILFAGSNFKPNHDGIKWFIENVLPEVPAKLIVVGRDFEKSREELEETDKTRKLGVTGKTEEFGVTDRTKKSGVVDGTKKPGVAERTKKLEVIGSVESTVPYYQHAACVVSPIFLGSGMKVKTAEALSYGKYIFGTKEAFEGYDLDFDKVGGICYNKQDFITKLNRFFSERAEDQQYENTYARAVFEEKYSFESEIQALKEVVEKVIDNEFFDRKGNR